MKFIPFPKLVTERLVLRQTTKDDGEEVLFLRSDKEVNKYIKRPTPRNINDAIEFIEKITKAIENNENIYWSITLKETPKMIGSICLWNFSADRKTAEVGYDLHPAFHSKGIMSETLACVLNFGFEKLALEEIEAFTHRLNESSKRLLVKHHFNLVEDRKDIDNADNIIFTIKKTAVIRASGPSINMSWD